MTGLAIKDQADADGTVRDRTFEDCEIVGPAMIVPVGPNNTVADCAGQWADLGTALRAGLSEDVVLVIGCTFRRCSFASDVDASRLLEAQ